MRRNGPRWLAGIVLVALMLTGCGVDGDTAQTVDEAVNLLQALERAGAWQRLVSASEALEHQAGYSATLEIRQGQVDEAGAWLAPPVLETALSLEAGGDGLLRVAISTVDPPATYLILPAEGDTGPVILRETGAQFICADRAAVLGLERGLAGLLEQAGIAAAAAESLAVVRRAETPATSALPPGLSGRKAALSILEPRLDDALALLAHTEQQALRERVVAAGMRRLSGSLLRDDDTGALLRLEAMITAADATQTVILFEVTRWGASGTLERPAPETLPACD